VTCETPATVRPPARNVLRNVDGDLDAFHRSSWNDRLGRFESTYDTIVTDRDLPIANRLFAGTLHTRARRWRDILIPNPHGAIFDFKVEPSGTRREAPRRRDA